MRHKTDVRLLTAKQAAAYLGISLYPLKRIEQLGYFKPYRTPGGHRRYSQEMLDVYLLQSREFTYNAAAPDRANLDSHRRHGKEG